MCDFNIYICVCMCVCVCVCVCGVIFHLQEYRLNVKLPAERRAFVRSPFLVFVPQVRILHQCVPGGKRPHWNTKTTKEYTHLHKYHKSYDTREKKDGIHWHCIAWRRACKKRRAHEQQTQQEPSE